MRTGTILTETRAGSASRRSQATRFAPRRHRALARRNRPDRYGTLALGRALHLNLILRREFADALGRENLSSGSAAFWWCRAPGRSSMGFAFCSLVRRRRNSPRGSYTPSAAVVIPCKGVDAGFDANLDRFLNQDYPDYQVVFVVATAEDLAYQNLHERLEAPAASGRHPQTPNFTGCGRHLGRARRKGQQSAARNRGRGSGRPGVGLCGYRCGSLPRLAAFVGGATRQPSNHRQHRLPMVSAGGGICLATARRVGHLDRHHDGRP